MPDYEKMYTMLNEVITDAIAAMERMQKIAKQEELFGQAKPATPEVESPPRRRQSRRNR